jgi:hypothetical protein
LPAERGAAPGVRRSEERVIVGKTSRGGNRDSEIAVGAKKLASAARRASAVRVAFLKPRGAFEASMRLVTAHRCG